MLRQSTSQWRMEKKKQTKTVGRWIIKWWRCNDDFAVEYKERVTCKYDELSEDFGGLEEEWKRKKKHLWELQTSYVEEHRERAQCQGVVTKDDR